MKPVYSLPLGCDFIGELKSFLNSRARNLSEITVVFPGKRPALYLRKALAEDCGSAFFPPRCFSIEEFIDDMARKTYPLYGDLSYADAVWFLFRSMQSVKAGADAPFATGSFGEFYPWGQHLFEFIEEIDRENVPHANLVSLEENAGIGYDVPESVNELLAHIVDIRKAFHGMLHHEQCFSRGYKYLCALRILEEIDFDNLGQVIFAGFFALTGVEREIAGRLWHQGKAEIIFEGDPGEWGLLGKFVSALPARVEHIGTAASSYPEVALYSGFDTHAEVLKVAGILDGADSSKTAIVLPSPETLFPLLTLAADRTGEVYNISLGYPLRRTSLFDLLSCLLKAQIGRRPGGLYPAADYLKVILHPFVKNLDIHEDMRTLLLRIERLLAGDTEESPLTRKPLVSLKEVEKGVESLPLPPGAAQAGVGQTLKTIHNLLFHDFEDIATIQDLTGTMERVLSFILHHTSVTSYVLSGEIFRKFYEILEELAQTGFSTILFHAATEENHRMLCDFLLRYLAVSAVPFETTPVEPLEILGVLETRNLTFGRVILLDMNEGQMPKPKQIDPLVPIGIYEKLGIPLPEENEEIYRYYFRRLIAGAKDVRLVYRESPETPRSRYIEQILWEKEKAQGKLKVLKTERSMYRINLKLRESAPAIDKTAEILRFMGEKAYSPSVVDDYIQCPLIFYYRHILGFQEKRDVSDDIDSLERGTIIHNILHDTFSRFLKSEIGSLQYPALEESLREALEKHFEGRVISGDLYLFKRLVERKLSWYLQKSIRDGTEPFVVAGLERTVAGLFACKDRQIKLKGRIDRIDYYPRQEEHLIIDYKTGGTPRYPGSLFKKCSPASMEEIHRHIKSVQLPIYLYLFREAEAVPMERLQAKLVLLRTITEEPLFKRGLTGMDRETLHRQFMEALTTVFRDIFDAEKPFSPFDEDLCPDCAFNGLCHV